QKTMGKSTASKKVPPKKPAPTASKEGSAGNARETNPREALFDEYYRNGGPGFRPGNAYQSALTAGYSAATAKSNCHLLARKVRIHVGEALRALGCDGFSQAQKLIELRDAKTSRWNSDKSRWDEFEDNGTQLEATKEINRIFDVYPAPKEKVEDSRPITIVFPRDLNDLMPATSDKPLPQP
ncbi:MAG: hypothetical protein ACRD3S_15930, partial [Terracidiphilus sp.]